MSISRRNLLRTLGAGAVANVAFPAFGSDRFSGFSQAPAAKPGTEMIRLDRNENAYGPSPLALTALREGLANVYRYPDIDVLEERLAKFHKVKKEQVVSGCGSS